MGNTAKRRSKAPGERRPVERGIRTFRGRVRVRPGDGLGVATMHAGEIAPVGRLGAVLPDAGTYEVHLVIVPLGTPEESALRWN